MEAKELLRKVRKIEIRAKVLSSERFAGEYHSAFKGHGMSFSEVREYQIGDDIRDLDWNVTARFNRPFVKVYEEERELTSMLLVDVSGSLDFGTKVQLKKEMMVEIAATLAFSAIQNNDNIGIIFFSDRIEKYIPPKKGRKHVLYLIRELLNFQPISAKTDINCALKFLMDVQNRRSAVFLISDFIGQNDISKLLPMVRRKHDLKAIQICDRWMKTLPNVGIIKLVDAENGDDIYIDTSCKATRKAHVTWWDMHQHTLRELFVKTKTDYVVIYTDEDYVKALMQMFSK